MSILLRPVTWVRLLTIHWDRAAHKRTRGRPEQLRDSAGLIRCNFFQSNFFSPQQQHTLSLPSFIPQLRSPGDFPSFIAQWPLSFCLQTMLLVPLCSNFQPTTEVHPFSARRIISRWWHYRNQAFLACLHLAIQIYCKDMLLAYSLLPS